MKRMWLMLLIGLTASPSAPSWGQTNPPLPDLVDQVRSSIVLIESFDAMNRRLGSATGFFIDNNQFVTTRHAVDTAAQAVAILQDGSRWVIHPHP